MSLRVQSLSTAATGTWSAMPKLRSRSEKRSPPSTASEPTAAAATTCSSASASRSRRSRTTPRCATVNTRHKSIAADDPAACRGCLGAVSGTCWNPRVSQVLNVSTEPTLVDAVAPQRPRGALLERRRLGRVEGTGADAAPAGRQGETLRERVLPFSYFPVTRGIRRYGLVDTLFAVRSANYARGCWAR